MLLPTRWKGEERTATVRLEGKRLLLPLDPHLGSPLLPLCKWKRTPQRPRLLSHFPTSAESRIRLGSFLNQREGQRGGTLAWHASVRRLAGVAEGCAWLWRPAGMSRVIGKHMWDISVTRQLKMWGCSGAKTCTTPVFWHYPSRWETGNIAAPATAAVQCDSLQSKCEKPSSQ